MSTSVTQRKARPDRGLMARIALERSGMPIGCAEAVRRKLGMEVSEFSGVLGIKLATYKRKKLNRSALKGSYGYAVSDVEDILAFVRDLLPDDKRDFDVARWFAGWIKVPQPALGGHRPEELLDTPTGRRVVRRVVGAMASGAYL
ncbi:MAG TPA: antitoxin Xre/MbcA/ParS toxin-binding domain-containing protein [Rhodanobacteraceae bacterium]|nr:antitoxin Xre/MbcA/ParS toxin-binding domain-containing protein [Rhodanobacteraceae bacterium]